jgi:hypothetical protein
MVLEVQEDGRCVSLELFQGWGGEGAAWSVVRLTVNNRSMTATTGEGLETALRVPDERMLGTESPAAFAPLTKRFCRCWSKSCERVSGDDLVLYTPTSSDLSTKPVELVPNGTTTGEAERDRRGRRGEAWTLNKFHRPSSGNVNACYTGQGRGCEVNVGGPSRRCQVLGRAVQPKRKSAAQNRTARHPNAQSPSRLPLKQRRVGL